MPVTLNLEHADLTKATPREIDADLFELLQATYKAQDEYGCIVETMHRRLDSKLPVSWSNLYPRWELTDREVMDKSHDEAPELAAQLAQVRSEMAVIVLQEKPYNDEFLRRGRWTRAYLVDNADGHLHKNTSCSTCRSTTRFHWITEVSGLTEREIVERAGEKACTVCYSSAPVSVLKRSSQFEGPNMRAVREAAEKRAAEKATRDAEKAEKAITNPDGTPLHIGSWYGVIKTERAAWIHLVDLVFSARAYDYDAHADQQELIVTALAAKTGLTRQEVLDLVEAKAQAKARREGVRI